MTWQAAVKRMTYPNQALHGSAQDIVTPKHSGELSGSNIDVAATR